MKIFFDCTYLRNAHTGVDVYFLNLVDHILKIDQKNEYTILVDSRYNIDTLSGELANHSNYKLRKIYSPLPLQVLYSAFFIPFYLRFKKIDVYHNPYFFGPLIRFICPSTKIVITVHDLYHKTIPQKKGGIFKNIIELFGDAAIKKADELIVISNQTKADVIKYLHIPANKLNLVYHALDNKFNKAVIGQADISKFGIKSKSYALTVSSVLPSKGLEDLIQSYAILINKLNVKNIDLVIVGKYTGKYIDELKNLVKQVRIEERLVKFLGYVDDNDLIGIYRNACMLISPSHYEGFGLPVLEGMKFGLPVIARNSSSLTEIVSDAGILFNNNQELASSMYDLLHNKGLYEALVTKGLNRIKDFSWEETAKKTLMVYEK